MSIDIALLGGFLLLAALSAAIRAWRLSRWIPIEAEVVHVEVVGPIGMGASSFARQLELQRRGQRSIDREIVYHAELLYVVHGVPQSAELTFDGPPDQIFPIRFDPDDPSDYTASQPDYSWPIGLAALGLATLVFSMR
jgi:hypothetical protein